MRPLWFKKDIMFIQGESKVGKHPVKYLMEKAKDRTMKLRAPF